MGNNDKGKTLQDAIKIAFEGIPGVPTGWVLDAAQVKAVREHVVAWICDYAKGHGVILDIERDIKPELDIALQQLHGIALSRTMTPRRPRT